METLVDVVVHSDLAVIAAIIPDFAALIRYLLRRELPDKTSKTFSITFVNAVRIIVAFVRGNIDIPIIVDKTKIMTVYKQNTVLPSKILIICLGVSETYQ